MICFILFNSKMQGLFELKCWAFLLKYQTQNDTASGFGVWWRNRTYSYIIRWSIDKKLVFSMASFYLSYKKSQSCLKHDIFPFNTRGNLFYCYLKLKESNTLVGAKEDHNDNMIDLFLMHCIAILKLEKCNIEDIHLSRRPVFISVIECNTPLYLLSACHH